MAALVRWLWRRLHDDALLAHVAAALAILAAGPAAIDVAQAATSLAADDAASVASLLRAIGNPWGLLASLGTALAVLTALMMAMLALRRPSLATTLAVGIAMIPVAGRIAHPHLLLGKLLARYGGLPPAYGVLPDDQGKLIVETALGASAFFLALLAYRSAPQGAERTVASLALAQVVGLGLGGGLIDAAQIWLRGTGAVGRAGLAAAEIAAETLVLGAVAVGCLALLRIVTRHGHARALRGALLESARPLTASCAT